tara:strand:- start:319 stop:648 length:330 start_codon:yes stop_codon:yes gene_type:complete
MVAMTVCVMTVVSGRVQKLIVTPAPVTMKNVALDQGCLTKCVSMVQLQASVRVSARQTVHVVGLELSAHHNVSPVMSLNNSMGITVFVMVLASMNASAMEMDLRRIVSA